MKGKKVIVGMSGGVDSSVTAALLKEKGFDVVGVYMKCWTEGKACTTEDDERSARLAASHLNIPFYVWNFVEEYRKRVVDYMLDGYQEGITPNPDVMCNKEIKFGLFFDKAMSLGADYIATGHYAKIQEKEEEYNIVSAKDDTKDQSYFLSGINPDVLDRVMFPLGNITKKQVRAKAKQLNLPNADRKDSQGVCFVGKVEVGEFLRDYIDEKKGKILDTEGKTIGTHDGAFFFTIGQRKGLGLAGGPYYVVSTDIKSNTVTVSTNEKDIEGKEVRVSNINWLSSEKEVPSQVMVKLRYLQYPFH